MDRGHRDGQRSFAGQGVVHEASGEGFLEGAQLALSESGGDNFDAEIGKMQGAGGPFGLDANQQTFGRQFTQAQVLHDILAKAAAERGQQKLSGGHAVIAGTVFRGLVDHDTVLASFCGEPRTSCVLQSDFQCETSGMQLRKQAGCQNKNL